MSSARWEYQTPDNPHNFKFAFQKLKYFLEKITEKSFIFVLSQAGAERKVSFDWGPDGSKAEDCFFGIVALDQVSAKSNIYLIYIHALLIFVMFLQYFIDRGLFFYFVKGEITLKIFPFITFLSLFSPSWFCIRGSPLTSLKGRCMKRARSLSRWHQDDQR